MNLNSVEIHNFHCFKESTFEFSKETTVLIGKNGSGKSSLVKAIRNGLSIFFSKNSWGYKSLAGTVSDLKVTNLNTREVWHDEKMSPADHVEVKLNACLDETQNIEWSFYKLARDKSNLQTSYYKDAYLKFMERISNGGRCPLFAYYSDRFPHIDAKLSSTIRDMLDNDEQWDRSWGYYHWDYDTSCAEIWKNRYIRIFRLHSYYTQQTWEPDADMDKLVPRIEKYKSELEFVAKYLRDFTDNEIGNLSNTSESFKVKRIYVDGVKEPYIALEYADGHRCRWDELPAGYERLFNIVFDIAYRSYILNGPEHEVEGIVFIDELDLHLHPSMEQDVLSRLRNAFPKLQLIVSTHSPLVISNFRQDENNTIIQMYYRGGEYKHEQVQDIYGMDYEMTLSAIMGTEPRNAILQLLWEKYVRLKRRNKVERVDEVITELRKLLTEERFEEMKNEADQELANEPQEV